MCQQQAVNLRHIPVYHHNLLVQHWVGGAKLDSSASSSKSLAFIFMHGPCAWLSPVINSKVGSTTTRLLHSSATASAVRQWTSQQVNVKVRKATTEQEEVSQKKDQLLFCQVLGDR